MVKITVAQEKISSRKYVPSVIEPSFGIGRILYALIEHAFWTRPDDAQKKVIYMCVYNRLVFGCGSVSIVAVVLVVFLVDIAVDGGVFLYFRIFVCCLVLTFLRVLT